MYVQAGPAKYGDAVVNYKGRLIIYGQHNYPLHYPQSPEAIPASCRTVGQNWYHIT